MIFGYESSTDAEAALQGGLAFDGAVLDFDLPGAETGLGFVTRMSRKLDKFIPTVILSGGTDSATLAALARSGRPWLTKPADPELIAATLSSVLKANKTETSASKAEEPADTG